MIELRWFEKCSGGTDFYGNRFGPLRVLQYRDTENDKWGEWKDVPVVGEPKTSIGPEDI